MVGISENCRWVIARDGWQSWLAVGVLASFSGHTDEDGAAIFQQACKMGLEGIVSKRLSALYRSGPSQDWIKVKNPVSPAMIRTQKRTGRIRVPPKSAAAGSRQEAVQRAAEMGRN
jgi:hypothetical protein